MSAKTKLGCASARLQDELMKIVAASPTNPGATVMMVTHDVDEAVLLSDRIVMMTNGPAATIGEVLRVDLPAPVRCRVRPGQADLVPQTHPQGADRHGAARNAAGMALAEVVQGPPLAGP